MFVEALYEMFFKRKSFRRFNGALGISQDELKGIENKINDLRPLAPDIRIAYKIVPREETTCKRGEYCLLIYSEEKEHYLLNIGYMFEQLDLYLASRNIGACWYGMGKTKEPALDDMKFIIMIAIGKGSESEFRKDYTKAKRKETDFIWKGDFKDIIGNVVKYAPSACNTQPWRVICESNILQIYQETEVKSIMPKDKVPFYNAIDMGIFLCFLEIALLHNNLCFKRSLVTQTKESGRIPIAQYMV